MALVATVVPWISSSTSAAPMPAAAISSRAPRTIASA
jgi:hypothetical protein